MTPMRSTLVLLASSLAIGATALAGPPASRNEVQAFRAPESDSSTARPARGVQTYQPTELTEDEREAARSKARYKMGTWKESKVPPPERPIPWMPLGFTLLTFAVVAPFAWAAFRRHVEEAPDVNAIGSRRRSTSERKAR